MPSKSLVLTSIPEEAFDDIKIGEKIFFLLDPSQVERCVWLRSFGRVVLRMDSESSAEKAKQALHLKRVFGDNFGQIEAYFIKDMEPEGTHLLQLPQHDRLFLISPPASPPVGWEQTFEDPPVPEHFAHALIDELENFQQSNGGSVNGQSSSRVIGEPNGQVPQIIVEKAECDDPDYTEKSIMPKTSLPPG